MGRVGVDADMVVYSKVGIGEDKEIARWVGQKGGTSISSAGALGQLMLIPW